jgi:3-deoxy-D-manno-octulosonic-acid transferase
MKPERDQHAPTDAERVAKIEHEFEERHFSASRKSRNATLAPKCNIAAMDK